MFALFWTLRDDACAEAPLSLALVTFKVDCASIFFFFFRVAEVLIFCVGVKIVSKSSSNSLDN